MALRSAYDDLLGRTLSRIQGAWGQLKYVAELRSRDGRYLHWGFERVHGAAVAQSTFAKVHKALLEKVLRAKLSSLDNDLRQSSQGAGVSPESYVSSLKESPERLLPAGSPSWARLHLQSILQTLGALEVPKIAGRLSSSPRRPLVRSLPLLADASKREPGLMIKDEAEEPEN